MSTLAEQVVAQLKTDMDNVYDAGYRKGVNETDGYGVGYGDGQADFGIQNEVKGTGIVTLDYVNENEHNVEVKLSSDTVTDFSGVEVKCIRKNLFDVNFAKNENNWIKGIYNALPLPFLQVGNTYTVGISENNMYKDYKTEYNGRFAVYISTTPNTHGGLTLGNTNSATNNGTDKKLTITEDSMYYLNVFANLSNASFKENMDIVFGELFKDFQIENSPTKTDYEPYTEKTYTANADGTVDGVTSVSPTMNIICDGVDISAKYYCAPSVGYDRFWGVFQEYGMREVYGYAFRGSQWNDKIFKPKYKVTPIGNNADFTFSGSAITSIDDKTTDLSKATKLYYTFQNSKVKSISINVSKSTDFIYAFAGSRELLELSLFGVLSVATFNQTFNSCTNLQRVLISGVIGNSISFQWSSLLEVESVQNIIDCLADLTGSTTQTLTVHADVESRMTDEQKATITSKNWTLAVA